MAAPHLPHPRRAPRPLTVLGWLVLLAAGWLGLVAGLSAADPAPAATPRSAVQLTIDGAIGPASADYVVRGLAQAQQRGAAAVVLRIDTPGGLDTSMREIVRAVLASPLPVLAHIAPSGARGASAGTFIVYASHVAAMAPGTSIGAAAPVQVGGAPPPPLPARPGAPPPAAPAPPAAEPPAAPATAPAPAARDPRMAKAVEDAVAYIRSLAELRGRNADWAESAVRDAASVSAEKALALGVIDFVATDTADLLAQAHGREVRLGEARLVLDTRGLAVAAIEPDWRTRLLAAITNPNVALILLMVGVYGLLFEFMNPGALVPGTVGAISLLLGLYALAVLPVSQVGAALLLLGMVLMLAEAFTPSVGVLGIGGLVAFVFGATMLIDADVPGYGVSLPMVFGIALASLALSLLIARLALRSHRHRVVTGTQALIGSSARVLDWSGGSGHVMIAGERWQATGEADLRPGQEVGVLEVRGLCLHVSAQAPTPPALP
jgi:membrane-bound serine protease (ClpP class)